VDHKTKILLIEDNPGDAKLVEINLQDSNMFECEIKHCVDLKSGIVELKKSDFDVVLLDLTLPDSRGIPTLEKLLEEVPHASVVLHTGLEDEQIGINAVRIGAQDYLGKGNYKIEDFSKTILYASERNKLQRQIRQFTGDLEKSKERLTEAQTLAKVGNFERNLNTNSLILSDQIYTIYEIDEAEKDIAADVFSDTIIEVDKQRVLETIDKAINDVENYAIEHRLKLKSGEVKYVNSQGRVFIDEDTGHKIIIGTVQDITDFKKAVEALEESEEQYKAIFEESRDAIYVTKANGDFLEYNTSLLELLGYTKEEFAALDANKIYLNPEDRNTFQNTISDKGFVQNYDIKLKKANGTILDCMITSTVRKNIDGSISGYHGIIRDVTEKRKIDELIKAKEIADNSARLKQQFLANMSHEIRTPMNVVVGMTHLLEDTGLNEKQKEYTEALKLSSENLLRIINDILDFSKIEAGKLDLEERPFKLNELIDELSQTYKFKAKQKKIDLFQMIDANVPQIIIGDALRLNQVLLNLVSNAIKYTHKGEIVMKVVVIDETDKTINIKFSVKDSGIGISEEKLATIFDSFTQASQDTTRLYGGTGLGLSIAKQMVELMGGTISVQSSPEQGSVFSFNAIFRKETAEQKKEYKDNIKEVDDNVEVKFDIDREVRILLTEDHHMNQIVASDLLNKVFPNLKLEIADNGQIAVDKIKVNNYDVVLMDISMPVMDGLTATKVIRAEVNKTVPIIALTAHAFSKEVENCLDAGMNDFVSKPINPKVLKHKLIRILNDVFSGKNEISTNFIAPTDALSTNDFAKSNGHDNSNGNGHNDKIEIDLIKNESQLIANNEKAIKRVTNLEYLKTMADGNEDTLNLYLNTIVENTPNELIVLKEQYENKNWEELRKIAHKMKSTIAYLGIDAIKAEIQQIENDAHDKKNLDLLGELIDKVDNYTKIGLEEIKADLQKISLN